MQDRRFGNHRKVTFGVELSNEGISGIVGKQVKAYSVK